MKKYKHFKYHISYLLVLFCLYHEIFKQVSLKVDLRYSEMESTLNHIDTGILKRCLTLIHN